MPFAMSVGVPMRPIGRRSMTWRRAISMSLIAGTGRQHLIAHIGVDRAGMHRVDADAVALAGKFERRRFGEQGNAALGHRIERVLRRADDPGSRGEVDDGAAVRARLRRLAQGRQGELGAEEDTGQIDRAQAVPFRERRRLDVLAEEQPGIVDQDVELLPAAERRVDRRMPVGLAGHVEMDVERRLAQPSRRLAAALVEHVADRHLGAGLHHEPRGLGADAARRAGNQRHLAVEPVHGSLLQCAPVGR
jgi:hypothetical protein